MDDYRNFALCLSRHTFSIFIYNDNKTKAQWWKGSDEWYALIGGIFLRNLQPYIDTKKLFFNFEDSSGKIPQCGKKDWRKSCLSKPYKKSMNIEIAEHDNYNSSALFRWPCNNHFLRKVVTYNCISQANLCLSVIPTVRFITKVLLVKLYRLYELHFKACIESGSLS